MSKRGYSIQMVAAIEALPHGTPRRLASMCVEHNVPARYVAKTLGVTPQTVYNWFSGASQPFPYQMEAINGFIKDIKLHARTCS